MARALGIINFAGNHIHVEGLQAYRPVGAFSFLGRYRVIDFPISNIWEPDVIIISIPRGEDYISCSLKMEWKMIFTTMISRRIWRTWSASRRYISPMW